MTNNQSATLDSGFSEARLKRGLAETASSIEKGACDHMLLFFIRTYFIKTYTVCFGLPTNTKASKVNAAAPER